MIEALHLGAPGGIGPRTIAARPAGGADRCQVAENGYPPETADLFRGLRAKTVDQGCIKEETPADKVAELWTGTACRRATSISAGGLATGFGQTDHFAFL